MSEDDGEFIAIAAADGVTGCSHGREGAQIACRTALQVLLAQGDRLWEYEARKISYLILEQVLFEVEHHAQGADIREYASTLMFACIRRRDGRALLWNLGDGAALIIPAGAPAQLALLPKRYLGRPCQTTTDQAHRAASMRLVQLRYGDSVMLCTDGALAYLMQMTDALGQADFARVDRILTDADGWDDASYIAWKVQ